MYFTLFFQTRESCQSFLCVYWMLSCKVVNCFSYFVLFGHVPFQICIWQPRPLSESYLLMEFSSSSAWCLCMISLWHWTGEILNMIQFVVLFITIIIRNHQVFCSVCTPMMSQVEFALNWRRISIQFALKSAHCKYLCKMH
jgi:hypothetical protein